MVLLASSEHRNKMNGVKKKLLASSTLGIVFLVIAIVVMVIDPVLIFTKQKMEVYEGSMVHEFLKKPLVGVHVSAYLFNITNAEEFMSGKHDKLRVEEVGPYTYQETRYNENLEIDVEAGVIRYQPRGEIAFVPEESVADPKTVNVTLLNLAMLGLTSKINAYPYWTRLAFDMLVSQMNSKPLITMDAHNYLWGYRDPLVTIAHNVVPGVVNFDKLGILDRIYDKKSVNKLEVSAGSDDKFMIKTRNGHKKLAMGSVNPDECRICDNFTDAYEGIGYPSGINKDMPIRIFRNGLCRMLNMVYNRTVIMDYGAEGLVYNLSDSFYSLDPEVTKNRILDLSDCFYGLPVGLTKVNFLDMDPEFYERIEGIKQEPRKESFIIVEPKVALQLETRFPVQLNLDLKDMSFSRAAKAFSNMVIPIGYVDIFQPPLPQETLDALHLIYVTGPMIHTIIKVSFGLATVTLLTYSAIVYIGVNKIVSFTRARRKQNMISVQTAQEPLMCSKA